MKAFVSRQRGAVRTLLIAAAIVVATLALARDGRPVEAVGSAEIVVSLSDQYIEEVSSLVLMIGADPVSYHIWAKDVVEPSGVSSFQIGFEYGSTTMSVISAVQDSTWLASTGRAVVCPSSWIDPNDGPGESGIGRVQASCNTFQPPPPYGPQGTGLLGTITLQLVGTIGVSPFDFRGMSQLINTPPNPDDIGEIPLKAPVLNVQVVECPDFDGDATIRVQDILYVVDRYFTSDLTADVNGDGAVTVQDILIVVNLYFQDCPAPA